MISDISEKSLSKAESLLASHIKDGSCAAVCCDGLKKIDIEINEVLIAGIGGEEIIKILKEAYIPEKFVFQPMKNVAALRSFLLKSGCLILQDDIFTDGKNYYFIVKGCRCGGYKEIYSEAQLLYGRDSLFNPVLSSFLNEELKKKKSYLSRGMSDKNRKELKEKISFIEGVLSGEIK